MVGGPSTTGRDGQAQGERAATLREADFELLFAASQEVLLVLRPDAPRFTMVAATDARLRVTHATRESLGLGLFEAFPDNPDEPAATGTRNLRASLERVLLTRQPDTMPVQKYDIRGPDGRFETKYWSPRNFPILSPTGEVLFIVHRVEDVTALVLASELGDALRGRTKQMEREVLERSHELAAALQELRATNTRLAQLDAERNRFVGNISHEFRTPLTLILGALEAELGNARALDPHSRMQLKVAHRNSLRLLKLVNSLLDFARLEAGQAATHPQPMDLAALTTEFANAFRPAIERGGLTLTLECPPLPEPIWVEPEMWEQIVLNLLSNAFKHTFQGGIAVRLAWIDGAAQLSVSDTGVGIAAAELPRLFRRFHRVEGAPSRTHEGTGIGLALVKELVALHGGRIEVCSEPGKGSRFTVTVRAGTAHLPARSAGAGRAPAGNPVAAAFLAEAVNWLPPPDEETTPVPAAPGPGPRQDTPGWSPPRARILWADDNADMRAYVTRLLGISYDVTAVSDGRAALESALAAPPDLVLSDVMMPRLDGFGLLRALRGDQRTRHVPIILLSARAGEESAVAGLDTGADDYLVKPFSARELLARVRTHVELAWQRRAWEEELEKRVQQRTAELAAEIARREAAERQLQSQVELQQAVNDHLRLAHQPVRSPAPPADTPPQAGAEAAAEPARRLR